MLKTLSISRIAALATLVATTLHAQSDWADRTATTALTVGLGAGAGASMILDPPEGFKVSPIFSYYFGAVATCPLSPSISASLAVGYENRGTKIRNEADYDIYDIHHLNYISITPAFHFRAFYIGMNFGLPGGGTIISKASESAPETSRSLTEDEKGKLLMLLEPRLGAEFPMVEDTTGVLSFLVAGGITLNEYLDRGDNLPDGSGLFNMVALYLGVSYQFAIPGTARY